MLHFLWYWNETSKQMFLKNENRLNPVIMTTILTSYSGSVKNSNKIV